jgi:hypothetical protein
MSNQTKRKTENEMLAELFHIRATLMKSRTQQPVGRWTSRVLAEKAA